MESYLLDEARKFYSEGFGDKPRIESWGPGRVNLIGEHTDYNEGYVLPLAVDRGLFLVGKARTDGRVILHSADYQDRVEFPFHNLKKDPDHPWADYFKGVLDQFQKRGATFSGCQAVLKGDLPQGAGLSSSASLEVATAVFLEKVTGFNLQDMELIKTAQAAENQFVGVQCGIMDQFASYLGKEGQVLFIDCRSLDYQWVPFPSSLKLVVCNTGVKRRLGSSAYNKRREECEEGVKKLSSVLPHLHSLRDVSLADFKKHENLLPLEIQKRCRHVISENQRVLDTMKALASKDLERLRSLLLESHDSLQMDYEVSCPELDLLVEISRKNRKVAGGRMTGAGFGGCTVNLVPEEAVEGFRQEATKAYEKKFRKLETYVFSPANGAKYFQVKPSLGSAV
ncbi:MAG TPA: galactokinase [bacterium]